MPPSNPLAFLQQAADNLAADQAKYGPSGIPVDEQGNKINPLGRDIDNFLRNLLGGEDVGGKPTPNLGVLPQAPTQQTGIGRVPQPATGAPIFPPGLDEGPSSTFDDSANPFTPAVNPPAAIDPSIADPGGTVGQQVPPSTADPLEPFGGLGPDGRTQFPPGSEGGPVIPPTTPPPVSNPFNRTGPGDILSGVGLNTEVDRPYGGNPRTAGATAVAAPAAAMFAMNPITAATVLNQGVRTGASNVAGGIRQAPSFIQMIKNWLELPGRQAMGQATRAAKRTAGKKARGKVRKTTKTRATKRTTKGKAEAARQRKAAEKAAEAAATRLGGG